MRKVLFAASEAHPLMKTGGLGDVAGSLPPALKELHCDVRILLPAYQETKNRVKDTQQIAQFSIAGLPGIVTLLECTFPETNVKTWLVDYPAAFDRPGNPYLNPQGEPWQDNAERFALFARAAITLISGHVLPGWSPDIVHCNDWQTGLIPALLSLQPQRPAIVFTIHNLAYQGLFSYDTFKALALPDLLWSINALEFYGQMSFIKGGLVYADMINTVSPTYAREIQTTEFGCGLDGLMRSRSDRLTGILNGIDDTVWNPQTDPLLDKNYTIGTLKDKAQNKASLRKAFSLPVASKTPLIGMVGRLVQQKGIDLVLDAFPQLIKKPLQFAILGTGDRSFESALRTWSKKHSEKIGVDIGYDEKLAHKIEGGADMFLMPSRFEPCGLNQLYSLRYGTVPVVRNIGGLNDTVVNVNKATLADKTATGIDFYKDDPEALIDAIDRAIALYRKPTLWKQIVTTGMKQKFSWEKSAEQYIQLYGQALSRV